MNYIPWNKFGAVFADLDSCRTAGRLYLCDEAAVYYFACITSERLELPLLPLTRVSLCTKFHGELADSVLSITQGLQNCGYTLLNEHISTDKWNATYRVGDFEFQLEILDIKRKDSYSKGRSSDTLTCISLLALLCQYLYSLFYQSKNTAVSLYNLLILMNLRLFSYQSVVDFMRKTYPRFDMGRLVGITSDFWLKLEKGYKSLHLVDYFGCTSESIPFSEARTRLEPYFTDLYGYSRVRHAGVRSFDAQDLW